MHIKNILEIKKTWMMKTNIKNYSTLVLLPSYEERLEYLRLNGIAGRETFGLERYLNQKLYQSNKWKRIRRDIIIRDNCCDLGIEGLDISNRPIIHHMNPITIDDIVNCSHKVFDLENLICVSQFTHEQIHYGSKGRYIYSGERKPFDTCPWKAVK